MADGYSKLSKLIDNNIDIIEKLNNASEENKGAIRNSESYKEMIENTKDALGDLFDLTDEQKDSISQEFLESSENAELMKNAIEGDTEALNQLREAFAEDTINNIVKLKPEIDDQAFEEIKAEFRNNIEGLAAELPNVEVGASLDDSQYIAGLNQMIADGKISGDEATKALSAYGIKAELTETSQPIKLFEGFSVPEVDLGPLGKIGGGTFPGITLPINKPVLQLAQVTNGGGGGAGPRGGGGSSKSSSPTPKSSGGGGGGGGGGGSKAKTIEDSTEKAKDIYQEVNETLERTEKTYDRINKVTDRLYGKDKINNIRKSAAAEKDVAKAKLDKLRIQEKELDTLLKQNEDINGNKTIHSFLGDDAFNPDGSIKQGYYEAKYDELYNYIKSFEGKDEEANKDAYDDAKKALSNFEEARKAYYDALNNRDDMIADLEDSFQTIQDASSEVADALQDMVDDLRDIYESSDDIIKTLEKLDNGLGKQI